MAGQEWSDGRWAWMVTRQGVLPYVASDNGMIYVSPDLQLGNASSLVRPRAQIFVRFCLKHLPLKDFIAPEVEFYAEHTCERTSTLITASTTEINRKITCLQWPVSGRPQ